MTCIVPPFAPIILGPARGVLWPVSRGWFSVALGNVSRAALALLNRFICPQSTVLDIGADEAPYLPVAARAIGVHGTLVVARETQTEADAAVRLLTVNNLQFDPSPSPTRPVSIRRLVLCEPTSNPASLAQVVGALVPLPCLFVRIDARHWCPGETLTILDGLVSHAVGVVAQLRFPALADATRVVRQAGLQTRFGRAPSDSSITLVALRYLPVSWRWSSLGMHS